MRAKIQQQVTQFVKSHFMLMLEPKTSVWSDIAGATDPQRTNKSLVESSLLHQSEAEHFRLSKISWFRDLFIRHGHRSNGSFSRSVCDKGCPRNHWNCVGL